MRAALLALVLVSLPATAQERPRDLATAMQAAGAAQAAYTGGRYAEAAALYEQAAAAGVPQAEGALYNAACSAARLGETDEAFRLLHAATDAGWLWGPHTATDPDLASLHGDPRWVHALAAIATNHADKRRSLADPLRARIVTEDIDRFWAAYDRASGADAAGRAAIYLRDYVEPGSVGLLDYFTSKVGSADRLVETVDRLDAYYADVRPVTLQVAAMEPQIRDALVRMKAIYPDAIFPDVTFVIGRLSSGGTASANGLLIGTEMFSLPDGRSTDDLPEWLRRLVRTPESLPFIVTHELVHFQQPTANSGGTLLKHALIEGVADMVADLAMPGRDEPHYVTWGRAHEAEVWARFLDEMDREDVYGDWLGNNGDASEDWPADLGYFVGSEIAWAYYGRADDKDAAVRDLLLLRDPEAIFAASGLRERHAAAR